MPTEENKEKEIPSTSSDERTTFSREYVHELREESKTWRLKSQDSDKKAQEAKERLELREKELEVTLMNSKKETADYIVRSEMKVKALAAGILDLDGLKLADLSKVSLSETGELLGAEEVIVGLKENKPYLFKEIKNSTTAATTPDPKPTAPKDAYDYKDAKDYKSALEKLVEGK